MRNSNITKNRIRVALLLVLAASIIGLAPAFSASARAARSFSVNDVSGNYVELANGWTFGMASLTSSRTVRSLSSRSRPRPAPFTRR